MAYKSYRYHANSGPTKLNRTSWGPVSAPLHIELPEKTYTRPISGNFDRIINTFDRTNKFECVRSVFEQGGKEQTIKEVTFRQNGDTVIKNEDQEKILLSRFAPAESLDEGGERKVQEASRFFGFCDIVVNGKNDNTSSSFERADVGLASKKTPCLEEEVTEYFQDRLYMSQARQLFPLQEDLADWINKTIGITYLNGENFLDVLDNGVELCQLATVIRDKAKEAADKGLFQGTVPNVRGRCWQRAARRSFFSRDNMDNFITFCRQLGVHENLLFESDDLVLHGQPRNVILCLLEVARIASSRFGLEPPGLVQLEREIALEEGDTDAVTGEHAWQFKHETSLGECAGVKTDPASTDAEVSLSSVLFGPENDEATSVHTDETWSRGTPEDPDCIPLKPLTELDKRVHIVTRLMQRNCNCAEGKCSKLLKVKKVGEGRYNIAGRNVFIRLLKGRHMMVRVGGGWDTLEHFLTRHDPCQVRVISPQSSAAVQKVTTLNLIQPTPTHNANVDQKNNSNTKDGDISPAELAAKIMESIQGSSADGKKSPRISLTNESHKISTIERKMSNVSIKSDSTLNERKSSIDSKKSLQITRKVKSERNGLISKSPSNVSRSSTSGRDTPMSSGKTSPNSLKSPTNGNISPFGMRSNGKISPSTFKLDLSSPSSRSVKSSGIINNRMISPIESSCRPLSAFSSRDSSSTRVLRSAANDGRRSLPSSNYAPDGAARRRSLNLSLLSTNAKSKPTTPTSKAAPKISSSFKNNSLKSPVANKNPLSPSGAEMNGKISYPAQSEASQKPFLHIRAKYRSPPPRDVPPR